MQKEGRQYLVGAPSAELKKWDAELLEKRGWSEIRDGLEVKLVSGPGGAETFILYRSEDRRKQEAAMHARFTERLEDDLQRLAPRLEKVKKPQERSEAERQIGRMLERNSRAAVRFDVSIVEGSNRESGLRLEWMEDRGWIDWAELTDGTYILRATVATWDPAALWSTDVQLTEAEAAIRIQKRDLQIRPIWHQREDRVLAHILVGFLGCAL